MSVRTSTHALVRPGQMPEPPLGTIIEVAWVFGPTAVAGPRMFVRTEDGWTSSLSPESLAAPLSWDDLITIPMTSPAVPVIAREVLVTVFEQ